MPGLIPLVDNLDDSNDDDELPLASDAAKFTAKKYNSAAPTISAIPIPRRSLTASSSSPMKSSTPLKPKKKAQAMDITNWKTAISAEFICFTVRKNYVKNYIFSCGLTK